MGCFNSPWSRKELESCASGDAGERPRYLNFCSFLLLIAVGLGGLISGSVFGQTLRTPSSASSTTATLPSTSSTSANAPCNSSNPTSPCFSAGAPRNPCYSAVTSDQPCATTTAYPPSSSAQLPSATRKPTPGDDSILTRDQAKAKIESQGYSTITGLRRDDQGIWHGRAQKNGSFRNVRLDREGNVTEN